MEIPTRERILSNYSTFNDRARILESEESRNVVFRSFDRILGEFLPKDKSAAILDVACGEGNLIHYLLDKGYSNVQGFDLSEENVAICKSSSLSCVSQHDLYDLKGFACEQRYDVIFALDIIEHLQKEKAAGALEVIRECLRPSGIVIVQTPNMGYIGAAFHRYNCLTHEFGITEMTAYSLFLAAGFIRDRIQVRASWNAATLLGRTREIYLRILHTAFFWVEGAGRPRIPTKNLLIIARAA